VPRSVFFVNQNIDLKKPFQYFLSREINMIQFVLFMVLFGNAPIQAAPSSNYRTELRCEVTGLARGTQVNCIGSTLEVRVDLNTLKRSADFSAQGECKSVSYNIYTVREWPGGETIEYYGSGTLAVSKEEMDPSQVRDAIYTASEATRYSVIPMTCSVM
jgi:hypothetical protein